MLPHCSQDSHIAKVLEGHVSSVSYDRRSASQVAVRHPYSPPSLSICQFVMLGILCWPIAPDRDERD